MRSKWFTVSIVAVALFFVGSQVASAGSVSSKQLASFKALDGPFSKADNKWTNALSSLSSKSSVAQVSKPSLAFVPALKTFDAGLTKIGFTGNAATQAADVVKLNSQLVTILSSIKSVSSLQSQLGALFSKYQGVQDALAKDLGVPAGDVVI
ncbi:MAG: hypothetical protein WA786_07060 [Acidimicrobiales bacterium]